MYYIDPIGDLEIPVRPFNPEKREYSLHDPAHQPSLECFFSFLLREPSLELGSTYMPNCHKFTAVCNNGITHTRLHIGRAHFAGLPMDTSGFLCFLMFMLFSPFPF